MDNHLSPPVVEAEVLMSFYDALREVMKGNRITRTSWDAKEESYGLLMKGFLTLHIHGKFSQWLVSDGDMEGTDWVVLGEIN